MSAKFPIISITGSSGAGTTTVEQTFKKIFDREKVTASFIEGDAFHRFDRQAMKDKVAEEKEAGRDFTVDWVHLKLNDQAQRTVLCKDPFRAVDERVKRLIASM